MTGVEKRIKSSPLCPYVPSLCPKRRHRCTAIPFANEATFMYLLLRMCQKGIDDFQTIDGLFVLKILGIED
jgi:hypothetical protein